MPQTVKNKRVSFAIRKRTGSRKIKPGSRQQRNKRPTNIAPKFAGSLHTIKLKPKGGAEVFFNSEDKLKFQANNNVTSIYHDLMDCVHNARKVLKKGNFLIDLKDKIGLHISVDWLLRKFEDEILPSGFQYNIEHDMQGYYFVIYKELDGPQEPAIFGIKQIVTNLKKISLGLHDLFILFLKALRHQAEIQFWFDNDYPIDCMEDYLENGDPDEDNEHRIRFCLDEHKNGTAKEYEKLINAAKYISPKEILNRLKRFRLTHPAIDIIKKGCEFMEAPYGVEQFAYDHSADNYDAGLKYYNQVLITWDINDDHFNEWEQFINCDANEGIFDPCISMAITPHNKKIDFDWLRNGDKWPYGIIELFNYINKKLKKV